MVTPRNVPGKSRTMASHFRKALRGVGIVTAVVTVVVVASASAGAASKRPLTTRSAQLAAATQPNVSSAAAFGQSMPVRDIPKTEAPSGLPRAPEIGEEALIHPTGDGSFHG